MHTPDGREQGLQVIIAGAGPVGLTLANLLGLQGVRTLVLEKESLWPEAPRAVALDDESLRIWQQCGLLEVMRPHIAEGDDGDVVFTYRARGGRPLFAMTQQGRPYGYARGNVFLFHRVLEILRAGLDRFPHVELRTGLAVESCFQDGQGVCVEVADPEGRRHRLDAAYLVGCDGGRSRVRSELGIALRGSAYAESWLIVDTFDPGQTARPLQEGVEVWCDRRGPAATIPLPGGYRRWEFLLRGEQLERMPPDDEGILEMIAQRRPGDRATVLRRLVHTYKACLADSYGRGRVFLAGDAAHLSPPFAGQGMATGLRDATNLGWKLAQVLQGRSAPELLQSYERERRPHQRRMLRLARRMGALMMPRGRLHEALVTLLFATAGRLPRLRRAMEIRGASITPVYAGAGRSWRGRAGHYLPQPRLATGALLDGLLGQNHCLISLDRPVAEAIGDGELAAWLRRGATALQLAPSGGTAVAYRTLQAWLGDDRRLLIVRPDRFVAEDRRLPRKASP